MDVDNNQVETAPEAVAESSAPTNDPNVAPVGLSLSILGLPKNMNEKVFIKKVKELGIKYLKADKPFGRPAAKLRFSNQEDRHAAVAALTDKEIDGIKWIVKLPADMGGELGSSKVTQRNNSGARTRAATGDGENGDNDKEGSDEEGEEAAGADGEPVAGAATAKDAVAPWHALTYAHQMLKKQRAMRGILEKIVKRVKRDSVVAKPDWLKPILRWTTQYQACRIEDILQSPITEGYRNKTELTIGLDSNGKPAAGFLLGGMRDGVVAIGAPRDVPSVSAVHADVHQLVEPFITQSNLPVWDRTTHIGFWRLLLIRSTINEETLVMFQVNPNAITAEQYAQIKADVVKYITESADPIKDKVKSIWFQEHSGVSNAAELTATKHLLWGKEYLEEEMLGTRFRISPTSFFQVNTPAASVLYDLVRQWCGDLDANTTLFDVCCGTGTIGLCIGKNSAQLKEIVGLEIVEDAVLDARANATLNNITNARFLVGKAEDTIFKVVGEYPNIKKQSDSHKFIAVLDPPRGGVHGKVLKALRDCEAITRIIYVSCNPNSLVNDASVLCRYPSKSSPGAPFVPVVARPVDLFPHTPHTELVMMFQRNTPDAEEAVKRSQHFADHPPEKTKGKRSHDQIETAHDDDAATSAKQAKDGNEAE